MLIAAYGGKSAYAQTYNIKLSDTGKIDVIFANKQLISGEISSSSFYNGFCLFSNIASKKNFINIKNKPKESGSEAIAPPYL